MTTPDGCGGPSTRLSREIAAPPPSRSPTEGRSLPSAAGRTVTVSAFAACFDLLAKEARAGRKTALLAPPGRDDSPLLGGDGRAGDTNARARIEDARQASDSDGDRSRGAQDDVAVGQTATLDPMVQLLGALAPRAAPMNVTVRPEAAHLPEPRLPVEQLMTKLVRRVAWSGNGRHGVARLELGAGELEGATLTIHADEGVVRVALDLPPGVDRAAWKERISGRLGLRGLQVEAVDVA